MISVATFRIHAVNSLCQVWPVFEKTAGTNKFNALGTWALQFATHTRQDDNSLFADRGFPSAPTATNFTMAAVVEEYNGPQFGLG